LFQSKPIHLSFISHNRPQLSIPTSCARCCFAYVHLTLPSRNKATYLLSFLYLSTTYLSTDQTFYPSRTTRSSSTPTSCARCYFPYNHQPFPSRDKIAYLPSYFLSIYRPKKLPSRTTGGSSTPSSSARRFASQVYVYFQPFFSASLFPYLLIHSTYLSELSAGLQLRLRALCPVRGPRCAIRRGGLAQPADHAAHARRDKA
jgi:hypothetical protein